MKWLKKHNLLLAWIVAVIAMSGSLYFSEIKNFIPCDWCWYQRILMYPLVLLLGIATFKKDYGIVKYTLPMAALGSIVAFLHYGEQKFKLITSIFGDTCQSGVPCGAAYINWAGFITIPFLSLVAFILIFMLLSFNKSGK